MANNFKTTIELSAQSPSGNLLYTTLELPATRGEITDAAHRLRNLPVSEIVIGRKIKDARLIKLVWKFLRAGYMEDWQYNGTYSGCPQGGIISPLLANIYLNELDKFAEETAERFYKERDRVRTVEYDKISGEIAAIRKQLKTASGSEKTALLKRRKELRLQLRKTPCASQTDKVMKYFRYADDFIIGVKGNKADCEMIKKAFADFICRELKMELSAEKTLITHSSQSARFLGYDVRVRRDNTVKPHGTHLQRTLKGKVELCVPFKDKIMPFLFDKGIIRQLPDGTLEPIARKFLYACTDLEIVSAYNLDSRKHDDVIVEKNAVNAENSLF